MSTPVTVVTGFLGAGKTTLINQWLAQLPRGEVAVIVNEVGTVGIDGELLAARTRELVEITGGCVCCATQAELVVALEQLAARIPSPARILIETSGAASPAGVLRAISRGGLRGSFALDGVITVVDATRIETLREHDLALEQIGYADALVLSRADLCDATTLQNAHDAARAQNGVAVVVRSPPSITLDQLLAQRSADLPPTVPRAPATHVYQTVSLIADAEVDGERLADFVETALASVAGRILRLKGILAVKGIDQRMIVQGVGDSIDITFGEPWGEATRRGRLVIVGFGLDEESLTRAFAAVAEP